MSKKSLRQLPTPSVGTSSLMDAQSYLTALQQRASASPPRSTGSSAPSTRSGSIITYASSDTTSDASDAGELLSSTAIGLEHEIGWKGLNTPMPPPSALSASRGAPTTSFDRDFIPDESDPYSLRHSEYGFDINPAHRTTSVYTPGKNLRASDEEPWLGIYFATYFSYALLIVIGHIRDFFGRWLLPSEYSHLLPNEGYAPLYSDFDSFYTRRLKLRIDDCFSRPVTAVASRTATLLNRTSSTANSSFTFTGETTQALNVSSYNYLGFAQSRGACADQAESTVKKFGVSASGGRADVGTSDLHIQCERLVANFLGAEDAMIVSMGFATNSTTLPALVAKGCLVISDELNHSSIRFGARLSGAMVRQYKHNDMESLESLLREVISQGQPRTHRPWKKILIVVEGLYSMEGTLVDLPAILQLKKKYKFYLYVDEAHSVGALGPDGRGVCDYFGLNPRDIDLLMGTFTKSFGASGGYIAGSHNIVASLRLASHAQSYAEAMSPPIVSQIITSIGSIMGPSSLSFAPTLATLPPHLMQGDEGKDRLRRLAFNCRYLSGCLKKMGFIVYGHEDSPIVPMLVFAPGKMCTFSRLMLERWKIVVVVVAYPATSLCTGRVRFCLSSAHTKSDLDQLLRACDDIGSILGIKLSPNKKLRMNVEDVIAEGVQMVRDSEYKPAMGASGQPLIMQEA